MIPRIIHCCWFGGPKTRLARLCRASWERFAPGFAIREWNESSAGALSDLPGYAFFRDALAAKKWAMASDWLRMAALYREGGVYLDCDVELVGSVDELCAAGAWIASEWTVANATWPNPGSGLALEKGSAIAQRMLETYARTDFDPRRAMMPFIQEALEAAIRTSGGTLRILPPEVMSPIDAKGVCRRTRATRGIHHYAMSGYPLKNRLARWLAWHGLHGVVETLMTVLTKVSKCH